MKNIFGDVKKQNLNIFSSYFCSDFSKQSAMNTSLHVALTFSHFPLSVSLFLSIDFHSVADPGSGAFLTPGSGIRNRFIPDPKPIFLRA